MPLPTHEHKTPWSLEQWHVDQCPACKLPRPRKVQEFLGKKHQQTLPELPHFGTEYCEGDCAE